MQATTSGKVGWKVAKLSLNVASVRYRAFLPILALQSAGQACHVFADYDKCNLDDLSVLVIVKGLIARDLELARAAHARHIPIVLDLCDCIFIANYGGTLYSQPPAEVFLEMAELASAIVVSTQPLAEIVQEKVNNRIPVIVIPDGIDSVELQNRAQQVIRSVINLESSRQPKLATQQPRSPLEPQYTGWRRIRKKISRKYGKLLNAVRSEGYRSILSKQLAKILKIGNRLTRQFIDAAQSVRQRLNSQPAPAVAQDNSKRILWFGNHGASYASFGMLDLLEIKEELETIASEMDVKLVVISDNLEKYQQKIAPLKIKSEYIAWNPTVVDQEFIRASVVVIPNPLQTFSICKSANRAVLALKHNVPVVATETPALRELAGCIMLNDFEGGLRTYLTDFQKAEADVQQGQRLIEELYGQQQTLVAWSQVVDLALGKSHPATRAA